MQMDVATGSESGIKTFMMQRWKNICPPSYKTHEDVEVDRNKK